MKYISANAIIVPKEIDIQVCANASRLSKKQTGEVNTIDDQITFLSRLVKLGDDHAKSLRGLNVVYSLTTPRYFWHEFVTYRIGNEQLGSESTMNSAPPFHTSDELVAYKRELKEGAMQSRIFMTNYQTLRRMYFARRNHRLPEWHEFCEWVELLPWSKELITIERCKHD